MTSYPRHGFSTLHKTLMSMYPCRIVFWSAEDGATSLAAFPTMEDVAAAVGGGPPEPWSAQIASQRTADGNAPEERRTQRTGRAEKDLHVVTLPSEESAQLILVHR